MDEEQRKNYKSETENLKFKKQILKFYPEDEAKMENMTIREKIEFIRKLKDENRYIIIDEI